jgi:NAD dependent epimerase/dehydratase family enzyme
VGSANLTAPNPVTNAVFTKTLGSVLGRPTKVAAPKFGLSTVLGHEMVEEMLLASQRVLPRKLLSSGFEFRHPELAPALTWMLAKAA